VGDRLLDQQPRFRDFERFLRDDVIPKSPPGTTFHKLERCRFATFYELRSPPAAASPQRESQQLARKP
jgi:hypothetical protein